MEILYLLFIPINYAVGVVLIALHSDDQLVHRILAANRDSWGRGCAYHLISFIVFSLWPIVLFFVWRVNRNGSD